MMKAQFSACAISSFHILNFEFKCQREEEQEHDNDGMSILNIKYRKEENEIDAFSAKRAGVRNH
jgi:hypothetical protein